MRASFITKPFLYKSVKIITSASAYMEFMKLGIKKNKWNHHQHPRQVNIHFSFRLFHGLILLEYASTHSIFLMQKEIIRFFRCSEK